VVAVIPGSPADHEGIALGDNINLPSGLRSDLSELESSERRASFTVLVSHLGKSRKLVLHMLSATELLERIPETSNGGFEASKLGL
jgi:hypothetical protein